MLPRVSLAGNKHSSQQPADPVKLHIMFPWRKMLSYSEQKKSAVNFCTDTDIFQPHFGLFMESISTEWCL